MRYQKQIKSVELVPGRDDDIIEFLAGDLISASAAIRAGLRLLIAQDNGQQDALDLLHEIRDIVKNGQPPRPERAKISDPFLDQSI